MIRRPAENHGRGRSDARQSNRIKDADGRSKQEGGLGAFPDGHQAIDIHGKSECVVVTILRYSAARFTSSNETACVSFASAYTLHCKVEGPCAISTRPWPTSSPFAARLRPARHFAVMARRRSRATGGLALLTALAQHVWLENPTAQPLVFFAMWAATAAVSAGLIWIEMQARSRRHHSGLADAMVYQAIEQFLPVAARGCAARRDAGEVCAGDVVDASGPVANSGEPRHLRLGPLVAAHRHTRRRLVFHRGFCSACCSQAKATRCRPGPWARRSSPASC